MAKRVKPSTVFPSASDDAKAVRLDPETEQTRSPSYKLAYTDEAFLMRNELMAVRLQLELLKPEILQDEYGIDSTVLILGSTRIPDFQTANERLQQAQQCASANPGDATSVRKVKIAERVVCSSRFYDEARELARLITADAERRSVSGMVVITGGGSGIMEAANRGAMEAGGKSIGLNIVLPFEQQPNVYVTPELCFQFHYFAIRKMHLLKRAKALVACPGGYGTIDELFETLTLIQTHKIAPVPVILLGRDYWGRAVNFEFLVDEGMIGEKDISLFQVVDSAEEAWKIIRARCFD